MNDSNSFHRLEGLIFIDDLENNVHVRKDLVANLLALVLIKHLFTRAESKYSVLQRFCIAHQFRGSKLAIRCAHILVLFL